MTSGDEADGDDRTFDDDQGRDSRAGRVAGGGRSGRLLESQSLLTVGPNGKVRANIKAREVVIYGSVRGNVEVTEKIAIREQGSLIGDIKSAGISIDDGAYFKGSIDIVRPDPKNATAKAVVSEARSAGDRFLRSGRRQAGLPHRSGYS